MQMKILKCGERRYVVSSLADSHFQPFLCSFVFYFDFDLEILILGKMYLHAIHNVLRILILINIFEEFNYFKINLRI